MQKRIAVNKKGNKNITKKKKIIIIARHRDGNGNTPYKIHVCTRKTTAAMRIKVFAYSKINNKPRRNTKTSFRANERMGIYVNGYIRE
jgi:hypothetical protein